MSRSPANACCGGNETADSGMPGRLAASSETLIATRWTSDLTKSWAAK